MSVRRFRSDLGRAFGRDPCGIEIIDKDTRLSKLQSIKQLHISGGVLETISRSDNNSRFLNL